MGCCLSADKDDLSQQDTPGTSFIRKHQQEADSRSRLMPMGHQQDKRRRGDSAMSSFNSSKGVGLGISMMMYQAGTLAGCQPPNLLDLNNLREQIRKAKAEGRTVTVMNGCVYIDYQLKAQIPPGFNLES